MAISAAFGGFYPNVRIKASSSGLYRLPDNDVRRQVLENFTDGAIVREAFRQMLPSSCLATENHPLAPCTSTILQTSNTR
ncbi:MAG: hypothetical protein IJU61_05610, partial [Victivallales bacterium]|nr:hypothetical protein [Victivallales bacterium]